MGKKKMFKQNFYKGTLPLAQGDRNKEVEGYRRKELHWPLTEMSIVFFPTMNIWIRVKVYEVGLCVLMWRNRRNKDDGEKQVAK